MSTVPAPQPVLLPGAIDVGGTRRTPFSRLVGVEVRKSYDTRAGMWLLVITGILVTIVMAVTLVVTVTQDVAASYGMFIATTAYSSGLLLPVLGIMLVTSEWGQRTAMVTFTLEPHRVRVILAKLVAGLLLTAAVVALAIVVGAAANLVYAGLEGASPDWEFGTKYFLGFVASQTIAMLTGFALATLFLNTPAAIVVFFVYSFVLPTVVGIAGSLLSWVPKVAPWVEFNTAQAPLLNGTLDTGTEWAQLAVTGFIWLVIPLTLGIWRVLRAEVK